MLYKYDEDGKKVFLNEGGDFKTLSPEMEKVFQENKKMFDQNYELFSKLRKDFAKKAFLIYADYTESAKMSDFKTFTVMVKKLFRDTNVLTTPVSYEEILSPLGSVDSRLNTLIKRKNSSVNSEDEKSIIAAMEKMALEDKNKILDYFKI